MNWFARRLNKYAGIIALLSLAASIAFFILEKYVVVTIIFSILFLLILLGLLFYTRKLIDICTSRLGSVNEIMGDYFGMSLHENQYFTRRHHFALEKQKLAETLVKQELPDLIDKIIGENSDANELHLFLDSGTTITPVFPFLVHEKINRGKKNLNITVYTNNLAGIDDLHIMLAKKSDALNDSNFNLLGGQPLFKYRATTGHLTQDVLEKIWQSKSRSQNKIVSIAVVTANWILAGTHLTKLSLCARGFGHLEFKSSLIENCDYTIIIAPLGKILPQKDETSLNSLMDDKYSSYPIPPDRKDTTFLLTSFRSEYSISPLKRISDSLRNVRQQKENENYQFCKSCPGFDPPGDKEELFLIEFPHDYVRKNLELLYHEFHDVNWR